MVIGNTAPRASEHRNSIWPSKAITSNSPHHHIRMPATTAETLSIVTRTVSVAPLVLLSVADHYGRSAKGTRKRVVGVLLGQNEGKNVRVSNSFAGKDRHFILPWARSDSLFYSSIRGRREGSISMVFGPQLRRVDERHVQED